MSDSKPCARCGDERHYTGSRWRCSRCYNGWQTKRRLNLAPEVQEAERKRANANRVAIRARWTPEKRAKANAQITAWRVANRERHRAGSRDWYARNAEHARAAKLAEYYRNPESFYARNLTRKARLLAAVCSHGAKCVGAEFLRALYESECFYCGAPAEHADHFYPLARGGLHCVENIVPACQACNSSKKSRDPVEFMESRRR